MRALSSIFGAFGLVALFACGGDDAHSCDTDQVAVTIRGLDGVTPTAFAVTARWGADDLASVVCPEGGSDRLLCTATGVTLRAAPTEVELVVEARGARTAHVTQSPRCDGAPLATVEVALAPLPELERNDDYATGLSAEHGQDEFRALAATVPTVSGEALVVKFLIEDLAGAQNVYFQNTRLHPLHYDFVRRVLGEAISQDDFIAATYHGEDRANLAGSILFYPDRSVPSGAFATDFAAPFTFEFFPSDDLSPVLALLAYRLLEERMTFLPLGGASQRLFYVPASASHEQQLLESARDYATWSAVWLTREEVYGNITTQLLNPGKACGMVHHMTPEELAATPLSYKDIVVLSRLPNEVPVVGGTITEELQTPLAHVNVAARARGTPNMALLGASTDERVAPFIGKLSCFEVGRGTFALSEVTLEEAQEFWDTLIPPEPFVPEADVTTTGLFDFATIGFDDAIRVGVKAANLAELSHVLPDNAPHGFAVPFAYYHQFMRETVVTEPECNLAQTDCVGEGRTAGTCQAALDFCTAAALAGSMLSDYVGALLDDSDVQTDTALREALLDGLRILIEHSPIDPELAQLLDDRVAALWGTQIRVKMRSSTNAEDLPEFSGAGLYSSFSAQVGTDRPPSSRIRKVWASVWNFQAFEERAFWNIDQQAVEMAVAVHPSYPDEDCNGVLITKSIANPVVSGFYVNVQLGEESVTNPMNGDLPEIFTIVQGAGHLEVLRDRYSSLSPGAPIMTDAEIASLYDAAQVALEHFAGLYGANPADFALDLEFKLVPPDRALVIKQARPYYQAGE